MRGYLEWRTITNVKPGCDLHKYARIYAARLEHCVKKRKIYIFSYAPRARIYARVYALICALIYVRRTRALVKIKPFQIGKFVIFRDLHFIG